MKAVSLAQDGTGGIGPPVPVVSRLAPTRESRPRSGLDGGQEGELPALHHLDDGALRGVAVLVEGDEAGRARGRVGRAERVLDLLAVQALRLRDGRARNQVTVEAE